MGNVESCYADITSRSTNERSKEGDVQGYGRFLSTFPCSILHSPVFKLHVLRRISPTGNRGQRKQTVPASSLSLPISSSSSSLLSAEKVSIVATPSQRKTQIPNHNMADENTNPVIDDVKVDESSVKPDSARRNSLEKHLAQRPEKAELIESMTLHVLGHLNTLTSGSKLRER